MKNQPSKQQLRIQSLWLKRPIFLEIWLVNQNSEGRRFYFNKQLIRHKLAACFNLKKAEFSLIYSSHTAVWRPLVCFIVRKYYKSWAISWSHKPGNSSAVICLHNCCRHSGTSKPHQSIIHPKVQARSNFLREVMQFKGNRIQIIWDVRCWKLIIVFFYCDFWYLSIKRADFCTGNSGKPSQCFVWKRLSQLKRMPRVMFSAALEVPLCHPRTVSQRCWQRFICLFVLFLVPESCRLRSPDSDKYEEDSSKWALWFQLSSLRAFHSYPLKYRQRRWMRFWGVPLSFPFTCW